MIYGIILAAGKGTRMNSTDRNKTTLPFAGKPMLQFGVELLDPFCDRIFITIGFQAETVKQAISHPKVSFVTQEPQLGTGHAAQVAALEINNLNKKPEAVIIGYGDHIMFYKPEVVEKLINAVKPGVILSMADKPREESSEALINDLATARSRSLTSGAPEVQDDNTEPTTDNSKPIMSFITADCPEPNVQCWGRVIRDDQGNIIKMVEQKDATEAEREVTEGNAGFYCFQWQFFNTYIKKLQPSAVSGEFYLNDLVNLAIANNLPIAAIKIPFSHAGFGVNTPHQLEQNLELFGQ